MISLCHVGFPISPELVPGATSAEGQFGGVGHLLWGAYLEMLKVHFWHCAQIIPSEAWGYQREMLKRGKASTFPTVLLLMPIPALFLANREQDGRWLGSMFCCEKLQQSTGLVPTSASLGWPHTPSPGRPETQERKS